MCESGCCVQSSYTGLQCKPSSGASATGPGINEQERRSVVPTPTASTTRCDTTPLMFRETGVSTATLHDTTPLNVPRNWCFYRTARHNTSNVRETVVFTTRRDTTPLKCSEKLAFLLQCRHDTTHQSKC